MLGFTYSVINKTMTVTATTFDSNKSQSLYDIVNIATRFCVADENLNTEQRLSGQQVSSFLGQRRSATTGLAERLAEFTDQDATKFGEVLVEITGSNDWSLFGPDDKFVELHNLLKLAIESLGFGARDRAGADPNGALGKESNRRTAGVNAKEACKRVYHMLKAVFEPQAAV